jgi:hypothetical protein
LRVVNLRSVMPASSVPGMARLVLVAAALVGFLAMHGFDMTDGAGSHHAAPMTAQHAMAKSDDAPPATLVTAAAPGHAPSQHEGVMVGCVFVLVALAGLTLALLSAVTVSATQLGGAPRVQAFRPARAPPCPVFISLCVFRL